MGSGIVSLIVVLGIAGITSALVSLIRRLALRRRASPLPEAPDDPTATDRAPQVPTAGGLAIVVVTLIAWVLLAILYIENEWAPWVFIVGGGAVAAFGLADDLRGLSRTTRVFVHLAVAVFVVQTISAPPIRVPLLPEISIEWLLWPLWVLWLTGLTNAYKFMVGVDGIASQQAIFAGAIWASLGLAVDSALLQVSGVCLMGGALGFIRHEWPPARIFMGDVGTTFLGFTLAALGLYSALLAPRFAWASCLAVWPFAFDSVFSALRSLARRIPIGGANRVHLHQRLVATGMSHRSTTLFYGVMSLVCALAASAWATSHGVAVEIGAIAVPAMVASVMWLTTLIRERRARTLNPS